MKTALQLVDDLVTEWKQRPEVLVVDDDLVYTEALSGVLERTGCLVDTAADSDTAIRLLQYRKEKCQPYDIIFLDLMVPPEHGPKILRIVRQTMPRVPVVIVTGHPEDKKVREALQYGYLGLVQKPIDLAEIGIIFSRHRIPLPKNQ